MTTCFLAPIVNDYPFFVPGGNTPANGAQLQTFVDGSSTPVTVYKDAAAAVAWSNPILLDSGGSLPLGGEIWIPTGIVIKAILAPAYDTFPAGSPYYTWPGLSGMNDVSTQTGVEWLSGPTPTFVSATSFTVAGDQTLTFTNGRRTKTANTGGTVYSTITSVTFGGGVTTVRVVNDSGSLDAGLSAVFYGLIDPAHPSIDFYHVAKDGGTVTTAANGTTDIWGIPGLQLHITGTNAIFSFSTASYAGATRLVIADSAFPINTSSIMSIPGGQNVTTSAGDRFQVSASTASAAVIDWYQSNSSSQAFLAQSSGQVFAGPSSGTTSALPTFRSLVGAESAYVLLSTKTANSSASFSFGTTDINWTDYDEYEFHLINLIPVNNATGIQARISQDGGATYKADATGYSSLVQSAATGLAVTTVAQSAIAFNVDAQSSNTAFGANGILKLYMPAAPRQKLMSTELIYLNSVASGLEKASGLVTYSINTTAINGMQFLQSAGNISGTIRAYGLKKT